MSHGPLVFYLPEKTSPDSSYEFSSKQMIHMKCQDIFSLKTEKIRLSTTNFAWDFMG